MNEVITYTMLVVVSILSVSTAIWFFRVRRKMIVFLRDLTKELENYFRPCDKTYLLLGYLVGYKARYVLRRGDEVDILVTTAPRYSLFYLPIAKILGHGDRLEIGFRPRKRVVTADVYVVREDDKVSRKILERDIGERLRQLSVAEVVASNGDRYHVYYRDENAYNAIRKLLSGTGIRLSHIFAYSDKNLVTVAYEVSMNSLKEFLHLCEEIVDALSKPRKAV